MNAPTLSFKKAAEKVLREAGEPLSPKEIVERALEKGLIETDGATPDATMGAQLYVDLRRNPKTPFRKVGRGKFTLRTAQASASSAEIIIDDQNLRVREALHGKLLVMEPAQFEILVAELLENLGYENVVVTGRSGDKGIDVTAKLTLGGITSVKTVVQVKRFKVGNNIGGNIIAQLRGSAEVDQRGLVNLLTAAFDDDLLSATDNLLRVLWAPHDDLPYRLGKFTSASTLIDKFRERCGVGNGIMSEYRGVEPYRWFVELRGALFTLCGDSSREVSPDWRLLRFLQALLGYGRQLEMQRGKYPSIPPEVWLTLRAVLEFGFLCGLGIQLPDALATKTESNMKTTCRADWERHLRENQSG